MNDSIVIKLNSGSSSIMKIGFILRAAIMLFALISCLISGLISMHESPVAALIFFALSLGLFIVSFKLLNAAFFSELLIVTKNDITVINKKLSDTSKTVIDLDTIRYLGFSEQKYTRHPLHNPVVDITGLATQERELQYVIDQGNMLLATDTSTIKFGKNMPSWDVEEVVEKIEEFTQRKFASPAPPVSNEDSPVILESDAEDEIDPEADPEPEEIPAITKEIDRSNFKKYTYNTEFGELVIEQRNETPGAEDLAYLNGSLAPTKKYQIGEKQFVMVSNGLVYATRGFGD